MKKLLLATLCSLFLLPLCATPARALGRLDYGIGAWCKGQYWGYSGTTQLGPWYSYWPLEAHFQQPAPTPYPFYPPPMTSAYGGGPAFASPLPTPPSARDFMTVGYSYQPPNYWYGR